MGNIEIFIGSPIEYDSERVAFQHILKLIQKLRIDAVIIANANIDKVQVDLIVAFENTAFVFEVKGCHAPLRGDVNGLWERKTYTGLWTPLKNYYTQTLTAKHVIKDALTKVSGRNISYPEGILLLVPNLHIGSTIPSGDFKVNIKSLDTLSDFNSRTDTKCTLQDWKKFALQYNLQKIATSDASFNKVLYEAEQSLNKYNTSIIDDYGKDIKTLVPVDCVFEHNAITSDDIHSIISAGFNFHITGQSGCAKTLIGKELVVKIAKANNIAVFIEAKYFEKLLGPLFQEEVKLLGLASAQQLFNLSQSLEKEIVVIIDGFNECPSGLQPRLIRCIMALCNRYAVKILLISQSQENGTEKLLLENITINPPSLEIKSKIASFFCLPESLKKLEPMMKAITSGLEARLIGEIGGNNLSKFSRLSLLEHFARIKLNKNSVVGMKCLYYVGYYLSEKIAYSLSIREFDKIIESNGLPPDIKDVLLSTNLIVQRFNKITFIHELFLNTFIAASLVNFSNSKEELIIKALNAPKNYDKMDLIIGAIDDLGVLQSVLQKIDSYELIISLFYGVGGNFCTEWVKKGFAEVISKIKTESDRLAFEIVDDSLRNISVQEQTLHQWSAHEKAFIFALPELLARGEYLQEIFESISLLDNRLQKYFEILLPEAKEKKISLRSSLFMAAYVGFSNNECALCRIISNIHSGFLAFKINHGNGDELISKLSIQSDLTDGQIYFALSLNRFNTASKIIFPYLIECLTSKWKYMPYHLRLQLLDSTKYYRELAEEGAKLISALTVILEESNAFISSSIFEALQSLGATEDDEIAHESSVIYEIDALLAGNDEPKLWQRAFTLYVCQFDHPYAGTYANVFHSLDVEKRKRLLTLAVQGAEGGLFTMPAILDLVKIGDPESCIYFEKWRLVPPQKTSFPQEDIYIFYLTHLLLARFNFTMPSLLGSYQSHRDNILCAFGETFYWLNRNDLDIETRKQHCKTGWEYLLDTDKMLASEAAWLIRNSMRNYLSDTSFTDPPVVLVEQVFSDKMAEICRKALAAQDFIEGIFNWDKRDDAILHAISMIEFHGSVIDIPLLKNFIDDKFYGRHAVDAIKSLQEKM